VRALTLTVAVWAAACGGRPRPLQGPVVEVIAVEGLVGRTGLVLEVVLLVENPNPRRLAARAVDWELRAAGRTRARGRVQVAADLPARTSVRLDVDCLIGPGTAAALLPLLAAGVVELEGSVHLDAAHGRLAWRGQVRVR